MTYQECFENIKALIQDADVSDIKEHLAFQFHITGEGEGVFYVEVKDGELHVEPYDYKDRDAVFICKAETLEKIASGKLDPVAAFTLQQLKIEGSIEKALKLKEILSGIKAKKKTTKRIKK